MNYAKQIKHPMWQKKRLEVLELHGFQCQTCGTKDEELHVHHPFYKRAAMIWEYEKEELECLCHVCHKNAHAIDEKIKRVLALCRQKQAVLDFILSLNSKTPAMVPSPSLRLKSIRRVAVARQPPCDENVLAEVMIPFVGFTEGQYLHIPKELLNDCGAYVRVIAPEDDSLDPDDCKFYAEHPELKPHPDDTNMQKADKFFAKMRLIMG